MTGKFPECIAAGANPEEFVHEMDSRLAGWDRPLARLRQALEKDELVLYCQPVAAAAGSATYPMAEVLVRLREEERSMLPPGEFLPLFEHFGLMPELDRWVARGTLRHLNRGCRIGRLALNVSMQSVQDAAFPMAIAEELLAVDVPGSALAFEIDEATLLTGGEPLESFCSALKKLGCGITVDGFGRRAVSFAPLQAVHADFVKVEGSIVRRLLTSETAEARLKAIIQVGSVFGYAVIAEMVETPELRERLAALGVPFVQGFGICRPQPIDDFVAH